MNNLHIKRRGDRVSLPEKEFKKLLAMAEELQDIKAYDRAMKRINAGKEEIVSWEKAKKSLVK